VQRRCTAQLLVGRNVNDVAAPSTLELHPLVILQRAGSVPATLTDEHALRATVRSDVAEALISVGTT
jgi:hypothetical protein